MFHCESISQSYVIKETLFSFRITGFKGIGLCIRHLAVASSKRERERDPDVLKYSLMKLREPASHHRIQSVLPVCQITAWRQQG